MFDSWRVFKCSDYNTNLTFDSYYYESSIPYANFSDAFSGTAD